MAHNAILELKITTHVIPGMTVSYTYTCVCVCVCVVCVCVCGVCVCVCGGCVVAVWCSGCVLGLRA